MIGAPRCAGSLLGRVHRADRREHALDTQRFPLLNQQSGVLRRWKSRCCHSTRWYISCILRPVGLSSRLIAITNEHWRPNRAFIDAFCIAFCPDPLSSSVHPHAIYTQSCPRLEIDLSLLTNSATYDCIPTPNIHPKPTGRVPQNQQSLHIHPTPYLKAASSAERSEGRQENHTGST